jgi:hypothetical protein
MNQRKRVRKCQLQKKRTPATLALMALPFYLKFAPFQGLPSREQDEKQAPQYYLQP